MVGVAQEAGVSRSFIYTTVNAEGRLPAALRSTDAVSKA